ncbi:HNH endonuclease, partial [bacterium]
YMAKHQHDEDAEDFWGYFERVIEWVQKLFPKYRKEMKGLPWGFLYNEYKGKEFDPEKLEEKVAELMLDDEVTNKKGIYLYVLNGKEKHLNLRAFSEKQKREAYEKQKGICAVCGKHFELSEMEADHIIPWSEGGKTNEENCQLLCKECNRRKSDK